VLLQCGDLVQDVVITAPGRDFVGALIFPNLDACRRLCARPRASTRELLDDGAVRTRFADLLTVLAAESSGSSTLIRRAILLEDPPSIDRQELTDKASVNQKAVLKNRWALVEELYAPTGIAVLVEPAGGIPA
jgi:feruloyl-CoA synthase